MCLRAEFTFELGSGDIRMTSPLRTVQRAATWQAANYFSRDPLNPYFSVAYIFRVREASIYVCYLSPPVTMRCDLFRRLAN